MSTNYQFSNSCPIPGRFDHSDDLSHALPDSYCQTPGGTLFSTTPGGTRIIYDRKFLLECWNSPVASTPPCCLPNIPGVTIPTRAANGKLTEMNEVCKEASAHDDQFQMDI